MRGVENILLSLYGNRKSMPSFHTSLENYLNFSLFEILFYYRESCIDTKVNYPPILFLLCFLFLSWRPFYPMSHSILLTGIILHSSLFPTYNKIPHISVPASEIFLKELPLHHHYCSLLIQALIIIHLDDGNSLWHSSMYCFKLKCYSIIKAIFQKMQVLPYHFHA